MALLEQSDFKVLGYIRPESSFHTLAEWEQVANRLLDLQAQGIDTRGGKLPADERLTDIVDQYFGFQLNTEVSRYDLLTTKNVLDFIEDFANHRFWGLEREFGHYFFDARVLKFAYFYSRGDLEPYVLLDDNFTEQIYGTVYNPKILYHYASENGVNRLMTALSTGEEFDISCFTVAERPFFRKTSDMVVTLVGNVRAGFRSDIKSIATDSGRRACNMHRLEYPGPEANLCYELESCDGSVKTSLWNEYIATPIQILEVNPA